MESHRKISSLYEDVSEFPIEMFLAYPGSSGHHVALHCSGTTQSLLRNFFRGFIDGLKNLY